MKTWVVTLNGVELARVLARSKEDATSLAAKWYPLSAPRLQIKPYKKGQRK